MFQNNILDLALELFPSSDRRLDRQVLRSAPHPIFGLVLYLPPPPPPFSLVEGSCTVSTCNICTGCFQFIAYQFCWPEVFSLNGRMPPAIPRRQHNRVSLFCFVKRPTKVQLQLIYKLPLSYMFRHYSIIFRELVFITGKLLNYCVNR